MQPSSIMRRRAGRGVAATAAVSLAVGGLLLGAGASSAATITMQVDITSDGDIFITPPAVTVQNGDTVRWRVNANIPGIADQINQGFAKWGHIRERYPAVDNPLGLAQEVSRHDWIASNGSTVTVGGAVNWPAGVNSYQYIFQYQKLATAGSPELLSAATGTLNRNPNPAGGPSVIAAGGNSMPVVKIDGRGNYWTTALDPFPPVLVGAQDKAVDLNTLRNSTLFGPAQGWTFNNGASIAGDFRITRYSAFESKNRADSQTAAEGCLTAATDAADNCFTVHWISRDPAAGARNLQWLQLVCTNKPDGGREWICPPVDAKSWTIDGSPQNTTTPATAIPFFNTPAVMGTNTSPAGDVPLVLTFRDKPGRDFPAPNDPEQEVTWLAHLYIADWDVANKTVTLHDGIAWGFTIKCEGTTTDTTVYKSGGAAAYMPNNHPEAIVNFELPPRRELFSCPARAPKPLQ